MSKFKSQKGFTLAELLVVVAIIAVLVAIAIPVFSAQLKKARLAVDHAAIRDAYAIVQIANNLQEVEIDGVTKTFDQLDVEASGGSIALLLSKDCSSLTKMVGGGAYYTLKATGSTEPGSGEHDVCLDCKQWDSDGLTSPISIFHSEGSLVPVTYVQSAHQLYLGWPL